MNKELLTEASCGLTNLKAETTYFVEVTAVDAAGNESVKSEKVTFKTLKAEEQKEDSTPEIMKNRVRYRREIMQTYLYG